MTKECFDEVARLRIRVEDEYVRKEDMAHTVTAMITAKTEEVMTSLQNIEKELTANLKKVSASLSEDLLDKY